MSNRKLQALRNLAERPGTEAEGVVAREMLKRFEAKRGETSDDGVDFLDALRWRAVQWREYPGSTTWTCACGEVLAINQKCPNVIDHAAIQTVIRTRFKKGDRVYYNCWAYPANCPAVVVGYVKLRPENGNHPWAWITVKFDHLKSNRQVPIYSAKGWHLLGFSFCIECGGHFMAQLTYSPRPLLIWHARETARAISAIVTRGSASKASLAPRLSLSTSFSLKVHQNGTPKQNDVDMFHDSQYTFP